MEKYLIFHVGQNLGPWTIDEVLQQLDRKAITWADYIFDARINQWVALNEHELFKLQFKKHMKMASVAREQTLEVSVEKSWYVLKGREKFGPFSSIEIVKLLQAKKLQDWDHIWKSSLSSWIRIADAPEFTQSMINNIQELGLSKEEVFFERRFKRAGLEAPLLIHNQKQVWHAKSLEIGSGGLGFLLKNSQIPVGTSLFLHFKPTLAVPAFNAIASVVGQRLWESDQYKYCVKFTNVSQAVQTAIQSYTQGTDTGTGLDEKKVS